MYKFRSNTFSKSQIPSLIPGHEEKCSVVIGCCRFAASMQHIYLQNSILRASTVSQTLISVHKEIIGVLDAQPAGKAGTTHIRVYIPRIPTLGIGGFFMTSDMISTAYVRSE